MSHRIARLISLLLAALVLFPAASHAARITLAWDANSPPPDGYRLYQRSSDSTYGAPVWSGTTTSCELAGLIEGTAYYFVVRAYVGAEESGDSNEVMCQPAQSTMHTITASAGTNGSITPSGSISVPAGASQTFTITAPAGYAISDVIVDGTSIGPASSYAFDEVTADHTIAASFVAKGYQISATAGTNGTITPSGSTLAAYGESRAYTIAPNAGHHVADVRVDGVSVGRPTRYTFSNITADHTIAAAFAVNTYTINATAGANGSISPSGINTMIYGSSRTFSIAPDIGFKVGDVSVDGVSVGALQAYTFTAIRADHVISVVFTADNQSPHADAGPDQAVEEAVRVTLSGLNSTDADDGVALVAWRQVSGPIVDLNTPGSAETTFIAPDVGPSGAALVFELTVTDYSGISAADTCIVNVIWVNRPPTAQAGADQVVNEGAQVRLNAGNSVDPDDGIAAYRWRQVGGPTVVLDDVSSSTPAFMAPDVTPSGESLAFELTVTDSGGLQDTDECLISVAWVNTPPHADAGPDQEVREGIEVTLDGANSFDSDDGIAFYRWTQTDGPPVALSDATSVQPLFNAPEVSANGGTLTFRLAVIDHSGLQHHDTCLVTVVTGNVPPLADAGTDQIVQEGAVVELTGSASSDVDDGISDYQWTQIGGPAVALSDPHSPRPVFTAPDVDMQGAALAFKLTVIDYSGLKAEDTCLVNIIWRNQPPVASAGQDRRVAAKSAATLNGSGSTDQDDGIAAYRWSQVSGPPAVIGNAAAAIASITAPDVATASQLVFELTVTDHGGLQSADRCSLIVDPLPQSDRTAPWLSITSPAADFSFTTRPKITIKGSAGDDRGISRITWRNQDGASGQAGGTTNWQIPDLRLKRWMNEITIIAYDAAGNYTTKRIQIFAGIWR